MASLCAQLVYVLMMLNLYDIPIFDSALNPIHQDVRGQPFLSFANFKFYVYSEMYGILVTKVTRIRPCAHSVHKDYGTSYTKTN